MSKLIHIVRWGLISLWLAGCALQSVEDLSTVNHPAMLFDRDWAPTPPSPTSSLGEYDSVSGGGGCTTCAH